MGVRDVVGDCYDIGLVVTGEPECALLWDMQDATENSGGKVLLCGTSGVGDEKLPRWKRLPTRL